MAEAYVDVCNLNDKSINGIELHSKKKEKRAHSRSVHFTVVVLRVCTLHTAKKYNVFAICCTSAATATTTTMVATSNTTPRCFGLRIANAIMILLMIVQRFKWNVIKFTSPLLYVTGIYFIDRNTCAKQSNKKCACSVWQMHGMQVFVDIWTIHFTLPSIFGFDPLESRLKRLWFSVRPRGMKNEFSVAIWRDENNKFSWKSININPTRVFQCKNNRFVLECAGVVWETYTNSETTFTGAYAAISPDFMCVHSQCQRLVKYFLL